MFATLWSPTRGKGMVAMAGASAKPPIAKLNAPLQVALAEWHADREAARSGDVRFGTSAAVERRRVAILVRLTGDAQALRDSGMVVNWFERETAFGSAALADLERLAALPNVASIVLRPAPHLDLDRSVPEVQLERAEPRGGSEVVLRWSARDDDDSDLTYVVTIGPDESQRWPVAYDLQKTELVFDTAGLAPGDYLAEVMALNSIRVGRSYQVAFRAECGKESSN